MTDGTLLAHLVPRFTNRIEDLAVEALGYILSNSEATRSALAETLRDGGVDVGQINQVKTQATGDHQERPDLAIFDKAGEESALIEAKFWAKLTDKQPVEYLKRLPDDRPAALLFVAPEDRFVSLWDELRNRVDTSNGISLGETTTKEQIMSATAGQNRHLLLTSWRYLLGRMEKALAAEENAETSVLCNIQQLQGLCEKMDSEAFLPLQEDELGPEFPIRMANLMDLFTEVLSKEEYDWFVRKGKKYKYDVAKGHIGHYIYLGSESIEAWLGIYFIFWRKYRSTPLWIGIEKEKISEQERQALESLELIDDDDVWSYIPIYLKTGVEYHEVLDAVIERLRRVAELLSS